MRLPILDCSEMTPHAAKILSFLVLLAAIGCAEPFYVWGNPSVHRGEGSTFPVSREPHDVNVRLRFACEFDYRYDPSVWFEVTGRKRLAGQIAVTLAWDDRSAEIQYWTGEQQPPLADTPRHWVYPAGQPVTRAEFFSALASSDRLYVELDGPLRAGDVVHAEFDTRKATDALDELAELCGASE